VDPFATMKDCVDLVGLRARFFYILDTESGDCKFLPYGDMMFLRPSEFLGVLPVKNVDIPFTYYVLFTDDINCDESFLSLVLTVIY
jgi:hypothetical protein